MIPLAILALGFAVRTAMFLSVKSMWGDEFYSLDYAASGVIKNILSYALTTNHPPLYYVCLGLLSRVLGAHEWVYRSLSYMPSVLTVWAVYLLGKHLFGRPAGRLAALLAAVSPYLLQSSSEIRSYGLFTMVSSFALLFFVKAAKKSRYIPVFMFFSTLLVYVEHMGVFVVAGMALTIAVLRLRHLIRPQLLILALQIPWMMLVGYQAIHDEKVFQVSRVNEYWNFLWLAKKGAGILWHLACGYQFSMLTVERIRQLASTSALFWVQAGLTAACAFLLAGAFAAAKKTSAKGFYLGIFVLVAPFAFLLAAYPIRLDARYVGFASPLFFALLGFGLSGLRNRAFKAALIAALTLSGLASCVYTIRLTTDAIHKEDFRAMTAFVSQKMDDRAVILGSKNNYDFYRQTLKLRDPAGHYEDLTQLNAQTLDGIREVWILSEVNMHDHVTDAEFSRDAAHLAPLGFVLDRHIRFGGDDALTVASLYRRTGSKPAPAGA